MTHITRFKPIATASLLALAMALPALQAVHAEDATGKPEASPMRRVPAARAEQNKTTDSNDRIFGGMEADKGEWPFQVALLTSGMLDESPASQPDAQFCGGSLIAPQWVLTAAHCLMDAGAPVSPDSMTVLTEATNLAEGKRYKVAEIIVNENYNEATFDNDLGLIRLAEPATAPTIKIAQSSEADSGKATVIGWGRMEDGSFPSDLMEVELSLFPNTACNAGIKQIYAKDLGGILRNFATRMRYSSSAVDEATKAIVATMNDPLTANMVCAGETTGIRDACNGDSGGPLFTTGKDGPVQVGIVSWGEGPMDASAACGHANAYGVYTRLGNYKEWIKAKTGL